MKRTPTHGCPLPPGHAGPCQGPQAALAAPPAGAPPPPPLQCPTCDVPLQALLFMGVQPDGYVCPGCGGYFGEDGKRLASVVIL